MSESLAKFAACSRACLRASALAAAFAIAACAVRTPLPDLPRDTPTGWRNEAAAPGGLQPDLEHWWHAFNDATLDTLIERALHDNLNLQIAGERLKAARALQHRASREFWPNLNFRVYEETAPNARVGYLEIGFDSTWEFGFFGRARGSERVAMADFNSAAIDTAAARVTISAEVAKTYVELRAAQARAAEFDKVVALRRRQIELAQTRLRTRLASQLELDRAQAELQQTLAEAGEPKQAIVASSQALGVLLGTNAPDPVLEASASQLTLPPIAIRETPADLLRTRPEIRRAEQNVLKAAGELGIARADLYPKLGINGTLISSTALTGDLNRPNRAVPLLGPTLSIPLFDWGMRRDVVNAREAALNAAVLAYREAVLEGVAEAQTALAQFDAKTLAAERAQQSTLASERSARAAQTLQRIGLGDGLDSANASLALAQSRVQASNAVRERALAYIALYKSLGGAMPPLRTDVGEAAAK